MNNHVGHVSMIQYHLPLPSDSAVQTAFQHVFFVDAYKHKLEVCLFLAGTSSIHDSLTLSRWQVAVFFVDRRGDPTLLADGSMAWRGVPSYLLIGLVCGLVFGNSLSNDFTFDDSSAIVSNRHVHTNDTDWLSVWWVDYWGTPIQSEHSHKSYRPLTTLTFRLNFLFSGLNAWSYHATNVLLHALVSCILYRLMLNVLNDYAPSLLLTLWFAVHPVKCDAVASIVGRAELLSTFFFLMALFCFFDNSLGCFFIYTILATLSKGNVFVFNIIIVILKLKLMFILPNPRTRFDSALRLYSTWANQAVPSLPIIAYSEQVEPTSQNGPA